MSVTQRTGRKLPKKTTELNEVMENRETNGNQKLRNKKRKLGGFEDNVNITPKKSKRKKANEGIYQMNCNEETQVMCDSNTITNSKKKKKRSDIHELETEVTHISTENGENEAESNTQMKASKKIKHNIEDTNEFILSTNNSLSFKEELPLEPEYAPDIQDQCRSVPKKNKRKSKHSEVNTLATHNGDIISTNLETLREVDNYPALEIDGVKGCDTDNIYNMNAAALKSEIDIEESQLKVNQAEVKQIYNNHSKEKEMKREVNVIAIKDEGSEENLEKVVTISISDVDGVNTNKDEDELLKQLERKLKPKVPKETINWPEADLNELLVRMEKCIPPNDSKPFIRRLDEMEWHNITFNNYTVDQCRNMWFKLQRKVRKYRLLNEVVLDAKKWVENFSKVRQPAKKGRQQKHPDMPRKPLTAYFLFYLENRDSYLSKNPGIDASEVSKALAQIFQSLTREEKKKYENIALQKREEYNKQLEEFYRLHPEVPRVVKAERPVKNPKPVKEKPALKTPKEKVPKETVKSSKEKLPKPQKEKPPKTQKEKPPKPQKEKPVPKPPKEKIPLKPHPPFHYFYLSELEKETVEDKLKFKELCKEKWKQLPERTKLVWIHYAEAELAKYEEDIEKYVQKHPDYVKNSVKTILTKEDLQIKDRAAGKPSKPPGSAYNLFASKLLQSNEIKKVPVRDRLIFVSNQWKFCSEEEKKHFKDMYNELMQKYKEEYTLYLESLPEEERQEELKKSMPKIVKNEVKKANMLKDPVKAKKKRVSKSVNKKIVPKTPSESASVQLEKLQEPQQPPISPFKYFCTIYSGEEPPVQKWKTLTKEEKKVYEEELIQKKKDYIRDFEKFLKSLSEEELEAFSKSRRKAKEEKQENEVEESDSYDSDESSEEEEEEQQVEAN